MSQLTLLALCAGAPPLFGPWGRRSVSRTLARYSRVATARGPTGARAADAVPRFKLVTPPVGFDPSRRALVLLASRR